MGGSGAASRARTLAVPAVVAAGSWAACGLLLPLPFVEVLYVVAGLTSFEWAVLFLVAASAASLVTAGLGLRLVLGKIRNGYVRAACGVVGGVAWLAAACYLGLICMFALWGVGWGGTHTVVTAEDGTRLMVTQDGFDGDSVQLYEPLTPWSWARRSDLMAVDPRSGPCSLHVIGPDLLGLSCGTTSQELTRH